MSLPGLKITLKKEKKKAVGDTLKTQRGGVLEARNDSSFFPDILLHLFLRVSGERSKKKIKKQRVGDFICFSLFFFLLCLSLTDLSRHPVSLKGKFVCCRQAAVLFFFLSIPRLKLSGSPKGMQIRV